MNEKQERPEPSGVLAEDLDSTERALKINVCLDKGKEYLRVRQHWWELWVPSGEPPPPPPSLDDAKIVPLVHASLFSRLTYTWISPLMTLGYRRTLQATDLWKVQSSQESALLSEKLDAAWSMRVKVANKWNAEITNGTRKPAVWLRVKWTLLSFTKGSSHREQRVAYESHWREISGRKSPSLAWALNDVFGWSFWAAGLFKVFGDLCQMMGPVLVREIIIFARERANARDQGQPLAHPGKGIVLAVGCLILVVISSLCLHQFFWRSMSTGVLARAALVSSIYKRAVAGTPKTRSQFHNAQVIGFVSTDVSRIEYATQWFHAAWTAPIQVTVCLIILLIQLGPSALAGFSIFILIAPVQERSMALQFMLRMKANVFTDQRARLLMEVISSMRIVKYFCYEQSFLQRIFTTRKNELRFIHKIQLMRSANIAFAFSTPVLAATLAFLTYTLTNNDFDVAVIFSSLSLFNLLRQPMIMLPAALTAASDAMSAFTRLTPFFAAETRQQDAFNVVHGQAEAILVSDASFEWENSSPPDTPVSAESRKQAVNRTPPSTSPANHPFCIREVTLAIPKGYLVGIVGAVGSGKSSLLQGLIGEMRLTKGNVCFGGRVAYCSQTAWIQNATIRANILFGRPHDQNRYSRVLELSCLLPDLAILPAGDSTEIGERGVNLSGGQRQRVNIARALYYDADVIILDDPLSAVDAHVGKKLFSEAILGYLRSSGKTVLLVTHALHFLPSCDLIYMMESGRITERGTFDQLLAQGGEFARLQEEFGGEASNTDVSNGGSTASDRPQTTQSSDGKQAERACTLASVDTDAGKLVNEERRVTGSVSSQVYAQYFTAGRGFVAGPFVIAAGLLMQGSQVLNNYTLVWWQANTWDRPVAFYQTVYGCLGVSQAILTFALGAAMDRMSMAVSRNMHHNTLMNLFHATMTFFDTTPGGRIISVFGKDVDVLDNQLPVAMRMVTLTISNLLGAVIIISLLLPFFLIAVFAIALVYLYLLHFYSASAREMKRLDAVLRSTLYAHLSESLTGLPTIRSYHELPWFIRTNQYYVDLENRALILTVTTQRWLGVRIELLGAFMVFIAALLAVMGVSGVTPAQIGLILTYTTTLTQLCSMVTRHCAEVENHMNSVERVAEYSRDGLIPQEPSHELPYPRVSSSWPTRGEIEMRDVVMSYRKGLPNVLCGISLHIRGGERIGVVGRTGAGKSSLTLALTRIVELVAGSILIDKVDIATLGLRNLRSAISIMPQEPLLFSGTIRSNLDPFSLYEDARLWDALRRSFLVTTTDLAELPDGSLENNTALSLESRVECEGLNLSVGQRSLLSLARALVEDTRIVILDEATASVDLATDSLIQSTISSQFSDRTLICIAHRLRTILSYDRIVVMDLGTVAVSAACFLQINNSYWASNRAGV